ncbi:MAG: hypothetical protein ACI88H_004190, partial [Cocleimonas sp.]
VIIFSMLLLILLFSSTSNFLTSNETDLDQTLLLVPENSLIMTLDFGSQKVERIGRGWRVVGGDTEELIDQTTLTKLIDNWRLAEISLSEQIFEGDGLIVVLWLAGQDLARVYQFYQQDQMLMVRVDKKVYQLNNMPQNALFLPGVL